MTNELPVGRYTTEVQGTGAELSHVAMMKKLF